MYSHKTSFIYGFHGIDKETAFKILNQDIDFKLTLEGEGKVLPENLGFSSKDFDFKKRELDCAVIRWAHEIARENDEYFDTVRAAFLEGEKLYSNAGFRMQNHIQISVLNPNCIKGVFLPRNKIPFPNRDNLR